MSVYLQNFALLSNKSVYMDTGFDSEMRARGCCSE